MVVVYIASPYTIGDQAINVRVQMDASDRLIHLGYCPIAPLLSHFQHMFNPHPYENWMQIDAELLVRSDALLRLPGKSLGADREVELAKARGIPVFYSIEDLARLRGVPQ